MGKYPTFGRTIVFTTGAPNFGPGAIPASAQIQDDVSMF
jgi:hypothetical protein